MAIPAHTAFKQHWKGPGRQTQWGTQHDRGPGQLLCLSACQLCLGSQYYGSTLEMWGWLQVRLSVSFLLQKLGTVRKMREVNIKLNYF